MNEPLPHQPHQLVDANEEDDSENEDEEQRVSDTPPAAQKPEKLQKAPSEAKSVETGTSSATTNSDLRDVLNSLKFPRDIPHLCPKTCNTERKKEECTYCREAYIPSDDSVSLGDMDTFSSHYSDYQPAPKPVRINMIHVKDCLHELESKVSLVQSPANDAKWCYCEEGGTSSEDDGIDKTAFDKIGDMEDQGILKYSHPRQVDVNSETGAIDWDKVSMKSDLQDILNCMFPPKTFNFNGQVWIQEVSPEPARRAEVVKLVELIELKMKEQQGKNYSIDPVRRQIFDQLFDELVRQETIVCAETGLLLLRLKDEMRMTVASWESLLDHANNFALKHITATGMQLQPLQNDIDKLIHEVEEVEKELEAFWAAQHLLKLEEKFRKEQDDLNRKKELAPLVAKSKMLKDQNKLLTNREQDDGTSKSYFS